MLSESQITEPEVNEPSPPPSQKDAKPEEKVDPTRYGDWVKNGRCIDF